MTASAGAWYRVGTVDVESSSQLVTGSGTKWQTDVIAIAIGDIFTLDTKTWYEVIAVNSDTSITLDRDFEGSTASSVNYAIVRNTSGTILTRLAGQVSVQFNQKQLFLDELRAWLNSDNPSEELTDSHGLKQSLKTPSQMVRDHDEKLAELDAIHPFPWAMRKVEFEARRAANNERYAASGFVHKGKRYSDGWNNGFVDSLFCPSLSSSEAPNVLMMGSENSNAEGDSKYGAPKVSVAGVESNLKYISSSNPDLLNKIKLPPAENGTRTYDSATGVSVTHATPAIAFASETETNKVVTDRVDMWGFEAFLREINDADPFVYANGLIQSLATNINGVPTVSDNVRPASYFAWYEGDEDSRGKGVNWQTATEAQRIAIASDPENNIYFDDSTGKFYQWCVRGRSFAGAGNGDWGYLHPTLPFAGFNPKSRLACQGNSGSYNSFSASASSAFNAGGNLEVHGADGADVALFSNGYDSFSYSGECYFLVCGTVNRLNQGAYHPSFNPSGTKLWNREDAAGGTEWYSTLVAKPLSRESAFTQTTQAGAVGARLPTGGINQSSGRPDGRFYNAIYASGAGGVCRDMRYSAWGLTQEDFAEADLKVKSGEYRGREKVKTTTILASTNNTSALSPYHVVGIEQGFNPALFGIKVVRATLVGSDGLLVWTTKDISRSLYISGGEVYIQLGHSENRFDDLMYYILEFEPKLGPIAGEYTHTEVIGDPANILLCDDLKDGWVGSWNPVIPDGVNPVLNKLNKPVLESALFAGGLVGHQISSSDQSITERNASFSTTTNSYTTAFVIPDDSVWVVPYKTKAVMTEDSVNSAVRNLNSVLVSDSYDEVRGLGYSLTGQVNTSTSNEALTLELSEYGLDLSTGKLSANKDTGHTALPFAAPTNNSPAFKALNYNVVENQQGFINYAYTELTYDETAGDWGADSKIHIVDNQSTMLDENGHTVLVGTARIVEPLGWIKNDK